MRFNLLCSSLFYQNLFSLEVGQPFDPNIYPNPTKFGKHNHLTPALKHQNKHRFIRSRKLSRQYK